jgi:hypothetical protein
MNEDNNLPDMLKEVADPETLVGLRVTYSPTEGLRPVIPDSPDVMTQADVDAWDEMSGRFDVEDAVPPAGEQISTINELVIEIANQRTGGYEVEFEIKPNMEKARHSTPLNNPQGPWFFTIIEVSDSEPGTGLNGEWWFWADGTVYQVL